MPEKPGIDLDEFSRSMQKALLSIAMAFQPLGEVVAETFGACCHFIDEIEEAERLAAEIAAEEERDRQAMMQRVTRWVRFTVGATLIIAFGLWLDWRR